MQKDKEKLKNEIYGFYKSYREETSLARRQTLFSLFFEKVRLWYNDYYYIPYGQKPEFEELGVEIWERLYYLFKMEKEPEKFFPYLKTILQTTVAEYYKQISRLRGGIITTEDITEKIYKINKKIKEIKEKRDLTDNDLVLICISENMDIREYERIKKLQAVGSTEYQSKMTGDVINMLNTYNTEENKNLNNQEQNYINGLDVELLCKNIKTILDKEKTTEKRECCRSLFTLFCMDEGWPCEGLSSVLDDRIRDYLLEKRKLPTQAEIYMWYYDDNEEDSAAKASIMKKRFIDKLIKMSQKNNS